MSISSVSSNDIVQSGSSRRSSDSIGIICTDIMDCPVCLEPFTIPAYEAKSADIFEKIDKNTRDCGGWSYLPTCYAFPKSLLPVTHFVEAYPDAPGRLCAKGHPACSSCSRKLNNKCPSCLSPISYIRCFHLEWLLEAAKVTCLNSKYGCKEILSYRMKREHERSCAYEPCFCPLPGCVFYGSYKDLYQHFAGEHPDSSTHFTFDSSFPVHIRDNMNYMFLQERDHTLFILNYGVQTLGIVADIICMGPSCLQDEYSYELEASTVNRASVKITCPSLQSLPKWTVCLPEKPVLVVPKRLFDSLWDHKIQVCIRRKGEN